MGGSGNPMGYQQDDGSDPRVQVMLKRLGEAIDPSRELALNLGKRAAINMDKPVAITRLAVPLESEWRDELALLNCMEGFYNPA